MRAIRATLFLISTATLTFEITLTRLFSVAQFYHFAFMIVSIALLGFGASGTALTIFSKLGRDAPRRALGLLGLGAGFSILGAYLLTNWLPFDSFSIAWAQTGWHPDFALHCPGNTFLLQWDGSWFAVGHLSKNCRRDVRGQPVWLGVGMRIRHARASIPGSGRDGHAGKRAGPVWGTGQLTKREQAQARS